MATDLIFDAMKLLVDNLSFKEITVYDKNRFELNLFNSRKDHKYSKYGNKAITTLDNIESKSEIANLILKGYSTEFNNNYILGYIPVGDYDYPENVLSNELFKFSGKDKENSDVVYLLENVPCSSVDQEDKDKIYFVITKQQKTHKKDKDTNKDYVEVKNEYVCLVFLERETLQEAMALMDSYFNPDFLKIYLNNLDDY